MAEEQVTPAVPKKKRAYKLRKPGPKPGRKPGRSKGSGKRGRKPGRPKGVGLIVCVRPTRLA